MMGVVIFIMHQDSFVAPDAIASNVNVHRASHG
jgi:hypothetical protein